MFVFLKTEAQKKSTSPNNRISELLTLDPDLKFNNFIYISSIYSLVLKSPILYPLCHCIVTFLCGDKSEFVSTPELQCPIW